jgi:hypothetical protein
MAENRCVQSNSQFTVEIRKRKSVVYEVAVLEIGKSWVHVEQASISRGREPLASKGISITATASSRIQQDGVGWSVVSSMPEEAQYNLAFVLHPNPSVVC